jgi:hypothetical protein
MKIFLYNLMLITTIIIIWVVIFPGWAIGQVLQTIKNKIYGYKK